MRSRGRGTPWSSGKYRGLPIREQVAQYRADGHPEQGWALCQWCDRLGSDRSKGPALGEEWMTEVERWTVQCQLSLPVVLRRLGIEPGTFPGIEANRSTAHPDTEAIAGCGFGLICHLGVPFRSDRPPLLSGLGRLARWGAAGSAWSWRGIRQRPPRTSMSKSPVGGLSRSRWAATTSSRECPRHPPRDRSGNPPRDHGRRTADKAFPRPWPRPPEHTTEMGAAGKIGIMLSLRPAEEDARLTPNGVALPPIDSRCCSTPTPLHGRTPEAHHRQ